jgi:hypothetical protein
LAFLSFDYCYFFAMARRKSGRGTGKSKGLNQLVDSIYEEGKLVVSDDQEVEIRETSCVGNLDVVVNDFQESEEESGG